MNTNVALQSLRAGIGGPGCTILLLVFLALSVRVNAQTGNLILKGHVKDPQGKPLPGVTVLARRFDATFQRQVVTDEAGAFSLKGLEAAKYQVEAKLAGFETVTREIQLEAAPVEAGFVLKPASAKPPAGAVPPGGRRGNSGAGQVKAGNRPRRGGFQSLTLQTPDHLDASSSGPATPGATLVGSEAAISPVDGESRSSDTVLIQGSVNFDSVSGRSGEGFSEERMQEVRERMREAMARGEFPGGGSFGGRGGGEGRPGGGAGGGGFGGGLGGGEFGLGGPGGGFGGGGGFGRFGANRIRGSIFERHGTSALDARPFSFSGLEQAKQQYIQNKFGVMLGGPLNIPKLYRGGDRTSFFFGYQGGRQRSPYFSTVTVPTSAERNGDFSQTFGRVSSSGPVPIFDPALAGSTDSRRFLNNRIPSERISPIALGLLQFVPLPNLPGSVLNYLYQDSLANDSNMVFLRLNHRLRKKDNLSFNYSLQQRSSDSTQAFPGFATNSAIRGQNITLSWTHNFSNRLVNNAGFRFNRMRTNSLNQYAFVRDVASELGITGVSRDPLNYGVPTVRFANYAALQDTNPTLRRDQTVSAGDTLTYAKGKHSWKTGAEYRRIQLNNRSDPNGRGTYVFNGGLTGLFDANGAVVPGTGYDFADFLLGLPQSTSIRYGSNNTYFRGNVFNLFVQDNWKISSRLTLNAGIRYELATPFYEKQDHIANLDVASSFSAVAPVLPGVEGPYSGRFPRALIDTDWNNLAPRIGLAWRPFDRSSTVVRSGYGLFYNASIYNQMYSQLASQPPFAVSNNLVSSPGQVLTLSNGFPEDPQFTILNSFAVDRNLRVGYVQQWNLDVQHSLRPNLILTVGYHASKGTRLDLLRSPNREPGSTGGDEPIISNAQEFLYQTSGASSIFHSMQLRLQRRFTAGLSLNGNYIYGRSIDNASSIGGGQQAVALVDDNLRAERGLSSFDMRHQFTLNSSYEFPFGERKRFLSRSGLASTILGNWSLNAVLTLQSGSPYTARILGSSNNSSSQGVNQSERADASGLAVALPASERRVNHFFNTEAFTLPPSSRFGNAGRNTITGPGTMLLNPSLMKVFRLSSDGKRLEFRAQATNILNTPNFAGLGTVVDSSNYGRLTSARQMRQFEFTLRLRF